MTLPGGRVILGWWRELTGVRPERLWYAHLLLHRVEVLVESGRSGPLTLLARSLFALLAHSAGPLRTGALLTELKMDPVLAGDLLGELARLGLVRHGDGECWEVLPASGQGDAQVNASAHCLERRSFYFSDGSPPTYLPLSPQAGSPLTPPEGWHFDLEALEACVHQGAEWKVRHGFPEDVLRVIRLGDGGTEPDWRQVPLVRAEQALLVLVETADSGAVVGFPVSPDGWALGREPVLSLPSAEVLVPVVGAVEVEAWRHSWQTWCQQRNLPAAEVEACKLEVKGHRLVVQAPPRLIERLRSARSDALKGEAWLLAGTGRARATALIDLGEAG
jgi:hypothetical protein